MTRWVDKAWSAEGKQNKVLLVPPITFALIALQLDKSAPTIVLVVLVIALWIVFILVRGWRMLKAISLKDDRVYDRREKYLLAPEYYESESATSARHNRVK